VKEGNIASIHKIYFLSTEFRASSANSHHNEHWKYLCLF